MEYIAKNFWGVVRSVKQEALSRAMGVIVLEHGILEVGLSKPSELCLKHSRTDNGSRGESVKESSWLNS